MKDRLLNNALVFECPAKYVKEIAEREYVSRIEGLRVHRSHRAY